MTTKKTTSKTAKKTVAKQDRYAIVRLRSDTFRDREVLFLDYVDSEEEMKSRLDQIVEEQNILDADELYQYVLVFKNSVPMTFSSKLSLVIDEDIEKFIKKK